MGTNRASSGLMRTRTCSGTEEMRMTKGTREVYQLSISTGQTRLVVLAKEDNPTLSLHDYFKTINTLNADAVLDKVVYLATAGAIEEIGE